MSDYNYLNARIKSLKRRLLPKGKLEELLHLTQFEEVKRFFLESSYGAAVSESLTQNADEHGIELGLSQHLHKTFQNILDWSGEGPRRLLELFLRRYDLHNIKTLLRGKNGKLPVERILETLIPVGTFGPEELKELSKQPTLRDTLVLLANWHEALKRVLRRSLSSFKEEPADLRTLESQLDHYYYEGILAVLAEERGEDAALVQRYIQAEVDIANILSLLRLKELSRGELSALVIDGGFLGKGFLFSITGNLKPLEVIQKFETTYLSRAVKSWKPDGGLTDLEKRFELFLLLETERMERCDPLSIGVALSYFAQLSHELKKIRLILHGKFLSLSEAKLREELLLV